MAEPISVVVASDAHYLAGLQTTVASVILHERTHPLHIHLLDVGMADWQWESLVATATKIDARTKLSRHRIDESKLDYRVSGEFTMAAYARILTPLFVPDPFAIHLDSDLLVTRPISQLLPYLETGKAVGAVQMGTVTLGAEIPWGRELDLTGYPYINIGVLLLDLDKWRRDQVTERLFDFIAQESPNSTRILDEFAINWILRDDMAYLPHAWNTFANEYDAGEDGPPGEIVIHYASGLKPWKRPLPVLSHKVWWLFNRLFPPAHPTANPLWEPRNLVRYVRHWGKSRSPAGKKPRATLEDWKNFWSKTRPY
jgi:UDP-glucose:(glucosyl)LPS alpha-1,3-glucosyltransferase/UDP-D-galactose:(glucosyl)LPS alpha-1,3-D-galactosyltransferase/UDP-glucose:(galactosyl)LPS alpha-1,2-glucosyltransferase